MKYRLDGSDLFKFFAIVFLTLFTGFTVAAPYVDRSNSSEIVSLVHQVLAALGFFWIALPCTAGAYMRDIFSTIMEDGKIVDFPYTGSLNLLLILAAIDPLKNWLISGELASIFRWDAMPFLALSMFVLSSIVLKFGIRALTIFSTATLFVGPLITYTVDPYVITNMSNLSELTTQLPVFAALSFSALIVLLAAAFIWFAEVEPKAKVLMACCWAVFIYLVFQIVTWGADSSPRVAAMIWNLSFSILVETKEVGNHIFPLFPWFFLVGWGYIIHDWFLSAKDRKSFSIRLLLFGLLGFALYLGYFALFSSLQNAIDMLAIHDKGTNLLIILRMLGIFWFYCGFQGLFYYLAEIVDFRNRIVMDFSHGIIAAYAVQVFIAIKLLPGSLAILGTGNGLLLFPIFVLLVTYTVIFTLAILFDLISIVRVRSSG